MRIIAIVSALCFASIDQGQASPIGPNCPTCQGGVYTLTYSIISEGSALDVFNINLRINTSLYTGGGTYIHAVAPKVSSSLVNFVLTSAPASFPNVSSWTTIAGGLNSNGCSGSGSGFLCTESTGLGALVSNTVNNWSWRVTAPADQFFLQEMQSSIKVEYVNSSGTKVGDLVSENITLQPNPVPEPSTLVFAAVGLLVVALRRKAERRL